MARVGEAEGPGRGSVDDTQWVLIGVLRAGFSRARGEFRTMPPAEIDIGGDLEAWSQSSGVQ